MRTLFAMMFFLACTCGDLSAAHFRDGGFLAADGVLESLRIEPRLPAAGESFTVRLTGSWPEVNDGRSIGGDDYPCYAAPNIDSVSVHPGNRVQIVSNLEHDPAYCDQPPVHWNLDVAIPASAWEAVDEEGFLLVEHLMSSGINMLTGINQVFDMRLGTHEVPAFLGAGFWVSAARPFEGIMIEQQGSRVLFYNLEYDRDASRGDDGEPVWQLISGEMYGDSTLGRAYRYDWPFDENGLPLDAPTHDQVLAANDSGGVIVKDYNHVRALTKTVNNLGLYEDYQRLIFGTGVSRLPVYVPPLDRRWTLHGFDGQNAVFTDSLELLDGNSPEPNQYHFASASGDWSVLCTIIPPGNGDCRFERVVDGVTFEFPVSAFQGNLARGNIRLESGTAFEGILVSYPWRLPVLDIQ